MKHPQTSLGVAPVGGGEWGLYYLFGVILPIPNWSPFFMGLLFWKSISSIFSLWTWRPISSDRVVIIFLVFTSMTSPVEG